MIIRKYFYKKILYDNKKFFLHAKSFQSKNVIKNNNNNNNISKLFIKNINKLQKNVLGGRKVKSSLVHN